MLEDRAGQPPNRRAASAVARGTAPADRLPSTRVETHPVDACARSTGRPARPRPGDDRDPLTERPAVSRRSDGNARPRRSRCPRTRFRPRRSPGGSSQPTARLGRQPSRLARVVHRALVPPDLPLDGADDRRAGSRSRYDAASLAESAARSIHPCDRPDRSQPAAGCDPAGAREAASTHARRLRAWRRCVCRYEFGGTLTVRSGRRVRRLPDRSTWRWPREIPTARRVVRVSRRPVTGRTARCRTFPPERQSPRLCGSRRTAALVAFDGRGPSPDESRLRSAPRRSRVSASRTTRANRSGAGHRRRASPRRSRRPRRSRPRSRRSAGSSGRSRAGGPQVSTSRPASAQAAHEPVGQVAVGLARRRSRTNSTPIIRPGPRMSPIRSSSAAIRSEARRRSSAPRATAFSTSPSSRIVSSTAIPAAHATGLPP